MGRDLLSSFVSNIPSRSFEAQDGFDLLGFMRAGIIRHHSQSFISSPWSPHKKLFIGFTKTTVVVEVPSNYLSFPNYHLGYWTMCIEKYTVHYLRISEIGLKYHRGV